MKKLRKRLFNIKVLSSLLIIGIFFCMPVFAAETSTSGLQNIGIAMNDLVSFLSWARVFFAILAGKLMTNDFVYGSFMNLDSFLWQMWNMMKNFANFAIGFMFLFYLIKSIFSIEDSPMSFIKNKIVGFLLAGVLIQMSWFLVGAVLDISTVATSAVGAFPASMIEDKSSYQGDLRAELERIRGMTITRDAQASTREKLVTDNSKTYEALNQKSSEIELNKYLDSILPNQNTLSGPLLFMGMSLFKFQDFTSKEVIKLGDREKMFITGGIQLFLVLIYTLAMFILFILNVARVVMLWVAIVFMPFLILFKVLKLDIIKESSLPSFSSIIKMIFAPVIFTAFMSIMLIFTFAVWGMLNPNQDRYINETRFVETIETSSIEIDEVASSTISGIKTGFADMLVYIMLIFLLWVFLKLSISMIGGEELRIVKKFINPLMQGVGKIPSSIPILPGPNGGMSIKGAQTFAREQKKKMLKDTWLDPNTQENQRDIVRGRVGLNPERRTDYSEQLTTDIKSSNNDDFFNHSKSYADTMGGLTLAHPQWSKHVESFLKSHGGKMTPFHEMENNTTLKKYFNNNNAIAKEFAKKMGVKNTNNITGKNIMTTVFK